MPPTLSILLSTATVDIASQRADLNDSGGQTNEAKSTQSRECCGKEVSFIALPFSFWYISIRFFCNYTSNGYTSGSLGVVTAGFKTLVACFSFGNSLWYVFFFLLQSFALLTVRLRTCMEHDNAYLHHRNDDDDDGRTITTTTMLMRQHASIPSLLPPPCQWPDKHVHQSRQRRMGTNTTRQCQLQDERDSRRVHITSPKYVIFSFYFFF